MGKSEKLILTAILLVLIDRIEFAYYPFQGSPIFVAFACCHEPIQLSWWVYLETIQVQHFLWTIIAFLWIPMRKEMIFIMIAFGLCVLEFPLTYGIPIAKLPLPFNWFFPLSCSLLRLAAILNFFRAVIMQKQ